MLSQSRFVLSFLLVCFSLSACATQQPADSNEWRDSQTPIIKMRAEARWLALIKGELEKAYALETPNYRAVVDLQQFKSRFGRAIEWRLAHAENVRYDDPAVATVLVKVTYRIDLPGQQREQVDLERVILEKWIYKDREWWYTTH